MSLNLGVNRFNSNAIANLAELKLQLPVGRRDLRLFCDSHFDRERSTMGGCGFSFDKLGESLDIGGRFSAFSGFIMHEEAQTMETSLSSAASSGFSVLDSYEKLLYLLQIVIPS